MLLAESTADPLHQRIILYYVRGVLTYRVPESCFSFTRHSLDNTCVLPFPVLLSFKKGTGRDFCKGWRGHEFHQVEHTKGASRSSSQAFSSRPLPVSCHCVHSNLCNMQSLNLASWSVSCIEHSKTQQVKLVCAVQPVRVWSGCDMKSSSRILMQLNVRTISCLWCPAV